MKIVRSNKIIDLDKFEKVCYRESFFGGEEGGYPVEVVSQHSGGFFAIEEEIARFTDEVVASRFVRDIGQAWVQQKDIFDVDEWMEKFQEEYSTSHVVK